MSKTFVLYDPNYSHSSITFGTRGIKITIHSHAVWKPFSQHILFEDINHLSIIMFPFSKGIYSSLHYSFEFNGSSRYRNFSYTIRMEEKENIEKAYNLVLDGCNNACQRKDEILGIQKSKL